MPTVHARALKRAAEILGGIDKLATFLNVPPFPLKFWIEGMDVPPLRAFLKAVDAIAEYETGRLTMPTTSATEPATRATEPTQSDNAKRRQTAS